MTTIIDQSCQFANQTDSTKYRTYNAIAQLNLKMDSDFSSKDSIQSENQRNRTCSFKKEGLIVKRLEQLIHNEITLELSKINEELNERLRCSYQEIYLQLKLDLRKVQRSHWEGGAEADQLTQLEGKVRSHLEKIARLKEINIYFNSLQKEDGSLEKDVQKFMFYTPKEDNLEQKLTQFFSEPTISDLFLKEYEKSFNPNNFSADLMQFFHFLHAHTLLPIPSPEQYLPLRNKDVVLIENSNIIFRQICDISDKYAHVQQILTDSYVHLSFIKPKEEEISVNRNKFVKEELLIQEKMDSLTNISKKIKFLCGSLQNQSLSQNTIILPQQPHLFEALNPAFDFTLPSRNQHFLSFLSQLYDGKQEKDSQGGQLLFLRNKIIRAETRWHLNRILSALNVGSHVAGLVDSSINPKPNIYHFDTPSKLTKYQFNHNRLPFYTQQSAQGKELTILGKAIIMINREEGWRLQIDKQRVMYPSAIHGYYYFLKYLLSLSAILEERGIYKDELLLSLIEIKADEMTQWAEIALNIYDIIKNRYFRCYPLLQEYLFLILRPDYEQQLDHIKTKLQQGQAGVSQLVGMFVKREKKAGWVSQIIFEFDGDHDVREALSQLGQIQRRHRAAFHCWDQPYFYQKILNEIIETRNNLKFDRCYSLSSLHQLFGFPAARPANLQMLAAQLAPLSHSRLRLPDLLRFYAAQTKLKREVFKAELYWITIAKPGVKGKFTVGSAKKKISFRDFLEDNAKNLLGLSQKPLSHFLANLEEFQRTVLLFSQEVDRLKHLQASISLINPDFPLEDHLAAFSHKQLEAFFQNAALFNLVEDTYIHRQKKKWLINNIKKLTVSGKLKYGDLCSQPAVVGLKHQLANFLFFLAALDHHYVFADCQVLLTGVMRYGEPPEYHLKLQILRSKRDLLMQYEQNQFMDAQSLAELVLIYEILLLQSILRLTEKKQIPINDEKILRTISKRLPAGQSLRYLQYLDQVQEVKTSAGIQSKAHSLASLKSLLRIHKQKKQNFKGYPISWEAAEHLCLLPQIGIVSRRLLSNQIINLKKEVSGDDWRSFNKTSCLLKLRQLLDHRFLNEINQRLNLKGISLIDPHSSLNEAINILQQATRKQIITQYDQKYQIEPVVHQDIILFDEFRGYEVQPKSPVMESSSKARSGNKHRTNFKRGMLNAIKKEDEGSTKLISEIQHKVNLQIVKESLPMRKMIYRLQLEQKRIRDEISWQTCKLQHNVINKINRFIEQSNLDQKQSLINFKYTVNLQTIKGIQNVIHQRTEIFTKTSKQTLEQGFMTEPVVRVQQPHPTEQSLLDLNVKNIFAHVKKLKVFWAWKNIYMSSQGGEDEWAKFSLNAQKILHNGKNIAKLSHLQELRQECTQQQILCNLVRQENALLNTNIRSMKLSSLTQKLGDFKMKHNTNLT